MTMLYRLSKYLNDTLPRNSLEVTVFYREHNTGCYLSKSLIVQTEHIYM